MAGATQRGSLTNSQLCAGPVLQGQGPGIRGPMLGLLGLIQDLHAAYKDNRNIGCGVGRLYGFRLRDT